MSAAFTRDDPPPSSSRQYGIGDVIAGKYELLRLLHNGGMGSVWEARHLMLDVCTAIKLIRSDVDAESLSERFVAEARLAARLDHPAIVNVFDLGIAERGEPFIAMELLHGEDLRDVLTREKRLEPTRCLRILLPIAEALAAAHDHAVIHRDLKPENVFIAKVGERLQPKIVDFGIARPTGSCRRRLTGNGTVVGSPEYMAPEQARGLDDVDHRADIWSFCAVLYECLTGQPPFSGTHQATLNDVVSKPIVPIDELGVNDAQLCEIVSRGLVKEPKERWQSMRELGHALAQWLLSHWVDDDVCGQSLRATWLKDDESALLHAAHATSSPPSAPTTDPAADPPSRPSPLVSTAWGDFRRRGEALSDRSSRPGTASRGRVQRSTLVLGVAAFALLVTTGSAFGLALLGGRSSDDAAAQPLADSTSMSRTTATLTGSSATVGAAAALSVSAVSDESPASSKEGQKPPAVTQGSSRPAARRSGVRARSGARRIQTPWDYDFGF